jgi:monomeric isocitrate dehydrogenase
MYWAEALAAQHKESFENHFTPIAAELMKQ